jgi:hypothetical protein
MILLVVLIVDCFVRGAARSALVSLVTQPRPKV